MQFWSRSESSDPPRHLPLPTGRHAVGYQDLMTAGPAEEGVFVRLYYPSVLPLAETVKKHSLWPLWSDDDYLVGFVKFMQAMLARWPQELRCSCNAKPRTLRCCSLPGPLRRRTVSATAAAPALASR